MGGLWYCLLRGGVNADVAGVIAACAMPAVAPAPAGSEAPPEHPGDPVRIIDHLVRASRRQSVLAKTMVPFPF